MRNRPGQEPCLLWALYAIANFENQYHKAPHAIIPMLCFIIYLLPKLYTRINTICKGRKRDELSLAQITWVP